MHVSIRVGLLLGLLPWACSAPAPAPAVASSSAPASARAAAQDGILGTLRTQHPRLMLLDGDLAAIRQQVSQDADTAAWYGQLQHKAEHMLGEPPVERKLVGPRLLEQSRLALLRIQTLAGLYRLDGDVRKAQRARSEMLAAARMTDWNPSHFLDVAEMTNALAIGYDWLYDVLSDSERQEVRQAIVEKGLRQALPIYRGRGGWPQGPNNWNQVCNMGMVIGALAVADTEPGLAREILSAARASLPRAMAGFAPDGGWNEGPGYWGYATLYLAYGLAALETALGTDLDLKASPGFEHAGDFRVQFAGPQRLTFNFGDANGPEDAAPQMFYLARMFGRSEFAEDERSFLKAGHSPSIFHLVWSGAGRDTAQGASLPTATLFKGVNVAFFRSAWHDPRASFLGFKGGDNQAGHAHLDLGSFVFDAAGKRWAADWGPDDYDLPGYFGSQRYTYYRLGSQGHNTLTVDGQNQNEHARSPIVGFSAGPDGYAVADLTEAYTPVLESARRGVRLLGHGGLLVQDELVAKTDCTVAWNLQTGATVTLDGAAATLTSGDERLTARILAPTDARFELVGIDLPAPQKPLADMRHLVMRVRLHPGAQTLAVMLDPAPGVSPAPSLEPLARWSK